MMRIDWVGRKNIMRVDRVFRRMSVCGRPERRC